jgi:uncharacterized protein with PQ loop repeat
MVTRLSPVSLMRAMAEDGRDGGSGGGLGARAADVAGLVITVLQVGQFVPQHLEMAADQSTAGLSPWLLFFGSIYTYLAFLDIALTDGAAVLQCGDGAYRCFISAQPFIQMLLSAAFSSALWYWFLRFYKPVAATDDEAHISSSGVAHAFYDLVPPRYFFHLNVGLVAAVSLAAAAIVRWSDSARIVSFAHGCGNAAALLNAVMWLPQIVVTAAYGHKGALSVHWVIASITMDIVYSVYLVVLGFDRSVWLNNVPDAIQTSLLLGIVLFVQRRDADQGTDEFGRRLSRVRRRRDEAGPRPDTPPLLESPRRVGKPKRNDYEAIPAAADA